MTNKFLKTAAILALAFPLTAPISAQTPDGTTPAQEGVCDVLQEESTTKGLYGLCVAFCEAHDAASIDGPITLEDLEALEQSAPSGKILTNYNKRKADTDPDMPCIKVEEPCPCFSDEDLASIDGFRNDNGAQTEYFKCRVNYSDSFRDDLSNVQEYDTANNIWVNNYAAVLDYSERFNDDKLCAYYNSNPYQYSYLSVNRGTLTEGQYDACRIKLEEFNDNALCDVIPNP